MEPCGGGRQWRARGGPEKKNPFLHGILVHLFFFFWRACILCKRACARLLKPHYSVGITARVHTISFCNPRARCVPSIAVARPKRQPKPSSDEGFWDCSVCTYKNTAEAFKCMMCDVRKGTSTRKPRPVSQLVSQQQATQQFVLPSQPKKEKKERVEREKSDKEPALKKNTHKRMRPRLKNIDRSSAQHLEVTVGDLTVIITDFKEKARPSSTSASSSSAASSAADHHSQNGSSSETTEKGLSCSSSPLREGGSLNGESH
ncbi:YY1-associated factor 2 isoform X1 [Syngnathus scovelli]|uniref:YY1-associated factor 2 isoform X1 n=1 Tax=Syngnathus scovelli TaxID=161590 RepID=UPI002110DC85|nr:YY1-associated factor 2 isoform X1 [Syngnathus scovelli]